jgi:hypothetical protein
VIRLAIRCHPCTPVAAPELEQWLDQQAGSLRGEAPEATVRLTRLTQRLATTEVDAGWLLELEVAEDALFAESCALADALAEVVRDMRFVGLGPTVLAPVRLPGPSNPHHHSFAIDHGPAPSSEPEGVSGR